MTKFVKPIYIAIAILVIIILWVLSGYIFNGKKSKQDTTQTQTQTQTVRGIRLEKTDFTQKIFATGISFIEKISLIAEVEGKITDIFTTEGQEVKKGDKILSIDAAELKSKYLQEKANLNKAKLELNSNEKLLKKRLTSKTNYENAKANYELAKANFTIAEENLQNTDIITPSSGVLGNISYNIGDNLNEGDTVSSIFLDDELKVKSNISERYINFLTLGSKVNIDFNGNVLKGEISYISSESNPQTRSFPIEITILDESNILDGQTAKLEILLKSTQAFNIPNRALTLDKDGIVGIKYLKNISKEDDKIQGEVKFTPINLTFSGNDGFWVDNIENEEDAIYLITIGSGFVKPDEKVTLELEK